MEAQATQTGARPRAGVVAWLLFVDRNGRGHGTSRLDTCEQADRVITATRQRERREGHRVRVELVRADGARVVASDQTFCGGRWVDTDQIAAAGEGARAS